MVLEMPPDTGRPHGLADVRTRATRTLSGGARPQRSAAKMARYMRRSERSSAAGALSAAELSGKTDRHAHCSGDWSEAELEAAQQKEQ